MSSSRRRACTQPKRTENHAARRLNKSKPLQLRRKSQGRAPQPLSCPRRLVAAIAGATYPSGILPGTKRAIQDRCRAPTVPDATEACRTMEQEHHKPTVSGPRKASPLPSRSSRGAALSTSTVRENGTASDKVDQLVRITRSRAWCSWRRIIWRTYMVTHLARLCSFPATLWSFEGWLRSALKSHTTLHRMELRRCNELDY